LANYVLRRLAIVNPGQANFVNKIELPTQEDSEKVQDEAIKTASICKSSDDRLPVIYSKPSAILNRKNQKWKCMKRDR
jgi:hypothetical protein